MTHKLGRIVSIDEKDKKFLMARRLAAPGTAMPTSKTWAMNGKSLNQMSTGTCVGHAWKNFLRCAPIQTEKEGPSQWDIYRKATGLDEWSDNDDEATLPDGDTGLDWGTSVRAGAQAVTAYGRLQSYLWAFELQPALEWVLTKGPIVLGVNWYSSFNKPDAEGIVKITPAARIEGGHAFLWRGANTKRALAACENSWGDGWARGGAFFIPLSALERLIHEQGECCTAIEQKLKAATL